MANKNESKPPFCHRHKTDISQRMCNSEVSYLLIQDTLFLGHRVLSEIHDFPET